VVTALALIHDPERMKSMSGNISQLGKRGAADLIAKEVLTIAQGRSKS
jgi:UDP-N-acetylglucosamine:LPS N-acetylglucosamine transferase